MFTFKRFVFAFVTILVLTACAGNRTNESTGEYIDDAVITSGVKWTILNDAALKFFDINVETYRGVVQLSGFVDSDKSSAHAAQIARTIRGVRMVNNSLMIKPTQ